MRQLMSSSTWYHKDIQVLENFKPSIKSVLNADLQEAKLQAKLNGTYIPENKAEEVFNLISNSLERKRNFVKPEYLNKIVSAEHVGNNFIKQMETKLGGYNNIPKPRPIHKGQYLVTIKIK